VVVEDEAEEAGEGEVPGEDGLLKLSRGMT